ncbi:MAG: S1C family serine protease, partial [Ignavibacteriales bacterium]
MKKSAILGATAVLLLLAGFFSAHLLDTIVSEKPLIQANAAANGSVTQVAKTLSPSIVGIVSYGSEGDFFSQKTVTKTGSGVVLDSSGYIVTNNHVVADSDRYQVVLANSQKKSARLIGRDQRTDLALLKVDGVRLTPAKLGDSSKLAVGETVVAIGNPLGLRFARSVTAGVISGLNRVLTTEQGFVFKLIQTDAAINPGNSGGALSNLNGEVVGINTIKISVQGFEGMGFAIPSNQVKEVLKELRSNGRVVRPIAGLKIVSEITAEEADYYNLPVKQGVTITPM